MAGSWLIASVCMLRMKHMSSAIFAVWGSISLIHMPHCGRAGLELVLRGGDREPLLARGHGRQALTSSRIESPAGPCRTISMHLRFVVEQVHLRRAADHVQVDDVLGLGRGMWTDRAEQACPVRPASELAWPCRP